MGFPVLLSSRGGGAAILFTPETFMTAANALDPVFFPVYSAPENKRLHQAIVTIFTKGKSRIACLIVLKQCHSIGGRRLDNSKRVVVGGI
tara:strand:+ start:4249 stop:4518 length:270 start_codon:yes stop_codon:yes gene_type:complete